MADLKRKAANLPPAVNRDVYLGLWQPGTGLRTADVRHVSPEMVLEVLH